MVFIKGYGQLKMAWGPKFNIVNVSFILFQKKWDEGKIWDGFDSIFNKVIKKGLLNRILKSCLHRSSVTFEKIVEND